MESRNINGPFRLAIVGAGKISLEAHLPAALSIDQIEVAAIVDPELSRARAMAREYGIAPRLVADIRQVASEVDGAIIATPNHTHKDLAVSCLEAGVSVLIEKPLANSVDEARHILDVAARAGGTVAVGYVSRWRDNVVLLSESLGREYFGRVTRFAHQYGTSGGWAPLSGYNLKKETAGGGVLVVSGSHFLDRMLYLWGYPSSMRYCDDSDGGPEANCAAEFEFEKSNGAVRGFVRYSKTISLPGALVIETERGIVELRDTDDADIVFRPRQTEGVHQVIRRDKRNVVQDGFALQLADFVEACRTRRAPLVDGEQGLQSMRLIGDLYAKREEMDCNWYQPEWPTKEER